MAAHKHTPPGIRPGVTTTGCAAARPSRRDLIAAAGFSALTGIAALAIARPDAEAAEVLPASAHPDAELLALITRFDELANEISATFRGADTIEEERADDAIREPLQVEQKVLLDKIVAARFTTLEGFRARARSYARWYEGWDNGDDPGGFQNERMAWALVRDLIGKAA